MLPAGRVIDRRAAGPCPGPRCIWHATIDHNRGYFKEVEPSWMLFRLAPFPAPAPRAAAPRAFPHSYGRCIPHQYV